MKQLRKLCNEKVVILEQGKDAKVKHNVERRPCLRLLPGLCFSNKQTASPRTKGCKRDEQQKPPVPPPIKHLTRHHNESVLQTQLPLRLADEAVEDEPIEQKYYRQEYRELDGVEKHNVRSVCDAKVRNYSIYRKQLIESEKISQNS